MTLTLAEVFNATQELFCAHHTVNTCSMILEYSALPISALLMIMLQNVQHVLRLVRFGRCDVIMRQFAIWRKSGNRGSCILTFNSNLVPHAIGTQRCAIDAH